MLIKKTQPIERQGLPARHSPPFLKMWLKTEPPPFLKMWLKTEPIGLSSQPLGVKQIQGWRKQTSDGHISNLIILGIASQHPKLCRSL